jgi:hypothetical protein
MEVGISNWDELLTKFDHIFLETKITEPYYKKLHWSC